MPNIPTKPDLSVVKKLSEIARLADRVVQSADLANDDQVRLCDLLEDDEVKTWLADMAQNPKPSGFKTEGFIPQKPPMTVLRKLAEIATAAQAGSVSPVDDEVAEWVANMQSRGLIS